MSHQVILADEILEGTNPILSFEIQDENGAPFQPTTLLLTLYDRDSQTLLGARPAQQDALNLNGVTVTAGAVSWQMTSDDNEVIRDWKVVEKHIALFEWTWIGSGPTTRDDKQEIVITVRNLSLVPVGSP